MHDLHENISLANVNSYNYFLFLLVSHIGWAFVGVAFVGMAYRVCLGGFCCGGGAFVCTPC